MGETVKGYKREFMNSQNGRKSGRTFVDHTRFEDVPDKELVERIIAGERELYEVIMRRYNQQLYRITWSYLSDEEAVRDTMQSAYIKAFEKLDTFRGEARFSTWLVRIAINEALQAVRNRKKRGEKISVTELLQNHQMVASRNKNPAMETERNDLMERLEEAIEGLPPKYRSVFVMREVEQMSTRETADCLDITRSNVKVRLHRARNMLRDHLEEISDLDDLLEFKGRRCDAMVSQVMKALEKKREQP